MDAENQVCTFAQALRLKKLGAEQKSLFSWTDYNLYAKHFLHCNLATHPAKQSGYPNDCAAFTVSELGQLFPDVTGGNCSTYYSGPARTQPNIWYCKQSNGKCFTAPTEAQARAEMIIYLLSKK
jgi:hypothetical protein